MGKQCPRVKARIECPKCGYPYSEAMYGLDEVDDPGCFKPVKLHTLDWGQEFEFPDDDTHTIYTLQRGNGMYMWVSDPSGHRFSAYIGEMVIPL